jgi:hypothetical protein
LDQADKSPSPPPFRNLLLRILAWFRAFCLSVRDFAISRLDSRMKCIRCGSRRVMAALEPPPVATHQRMRA